MQTEKSHQKGNELQIVISNEVFEIGVRGFTKILRNEEKKKSGTEVDAIEIMAQFFLKYYTAAK